MTHYPIRLSIVLMISSNLILMTQVNPSSSQPMEKKNLISGFLAIEFNEDHIISLRCDATGTGHYGPNLVATAGAITGVKDVKIEGNKAFLEPTAKPFRWDFPFVWKGYYDADLQINYPSELSTEGAYPLSLPVRKFITSAGQVLFMEHFKRLPLGGPYYINLNINQGSQLLVSCNDRLNHDLKVTFPRQNTLNYNLAEESIQVSCQEMQEPIVIEVIPKDSEVTPGNQLVHPSASFQPDFLATFEMTGKQVSASALLTDLLQMGIYWASRIQGGGEWGLNAVETHMFDDPRGYYPKAMRDVLLEQIALIGYDRMEHFGMLFPWGRLPDYGAGGLLNVPENNGAYDMRMLHLNGQFIQETATYVLHSGDVAFLNAKRSRWLSTDGKEFQPLCGAKAHLGDYVLTAGDVRLDRKKAEAFFNLGQIFTPTASFKQISLRVGAEGKEPAIGILSLYKGFQDELIYTEEITINPGERDRTITLQLPTEQPAGEYTLTLTDKRSLEGRYFGSSLYWYTEQESTDTNGEASIGPFRGATNYDRLKLLFEYTYQHTGPVRENLSYYQNDPEYNIPDHKSGRNAVGTTNTYWESPGGGYESVTGLWYNAACSALGEISSLLGKPEEATHYRNLRVLADKAYNEKFWHTFSENGKEWSRYLGCIDWDGVLHDFGFSYYNLEAAYRGIPSSSQVRQILWWLDRGYYSPDRRVSWKPQIYSLWEIAPPFNTISNDTWMNVTGTLPFLQVLANGGTRLNIAGLDLAVRARHLSIDNMHERNKRILGRYASPDRLTGGRTFDDPGGRGRWHFGPPHEERADIEGFREIFPPNGVLASFQPVAYLGMTASATGLWLQPAVPSELDSYSFNGLAYAGGVFNFKVNAERQKAEYTIQTGGNPWETVFQPTVRFNKVGMLAQLSPFKIRSNAQLSLTLEQKEGDEWKEVAVNWYSHVQDNQWVWVSVDRWLLPDLDYRLRIHDVSTPEGETLSLVTGEAGSPKIEVNAELTHLQIDLINNPKNKTFLLTPREGNSSSPESFQCVLEPGQKALLK